MVTFHVIWWFDYKSFNLNGKMNEKNKDAFPDERTTGDDEVWLGDVWERHANALFCF